MAEKNIFVATSYSSHVNYETGEVNHEYRDWLEDVLQGIEQHGYTVFNALRADNYRIDESPKEAFALDRVRIEQCDTMLAILEEKGSEGVQTEIGIAIGLGKIVMLGHTESLKLGYFNNALVSAGVAHDIRMPLDYAQISAIVTP